MHLKQGFAAALFFILSACTMPLPQDIEPDSCPGVDTAGNITRANNSTCLPSAPGNGSNGNTDETQLPLNQLKIIKAVERRSARYTQQAVEFLNLDTCPDGSPQCFNALSPQRQTLTRYEFFFNDNSPVFGQFPVFDAPTSSELDQPFRRIVRVIVPNDYEPNTIQSAEDVVASRYRTEASDRVENNPLILANALPDFGVIFGRAWMQNQFVDYLELGSVPNSSNNLGTSFVYFLRNNDKTDLPSRPEPILDTIPGDLLYSPIRQVFRAVSEEQIQSLDADPSPNIRSQDDLLQAINNGLFRLEETQEFFNFPVYRNINNNAGAQAQIIALRIQNATHFPGSPEGAHYTLWAINQALEPLLVAEFTAQNNRLNQLNGKVLETGENGEVLFRFNQNQIRNFRQFLLTIESGQFNQPSGPTLLESEFNFRNSLTLEVPFAANYTQLENGNFLLAASSSENRSQDTNGLWFVQRQDNAVTELPLTQNLSPGLPLPTAPRGWHYQGWLKTELRSPIWLKTGNFQQADGPDNSSLYRNPARETYPFPGEDFLLNAPQALFFPLNLISTGEREVFVSLEPQGLERKEPFFTLYHQVLLRSLAPRQNQVLEAQTLRFPQLQLSLNQE